MDREAVGQGQLLMLTNVCLFVRYGLRQESGSSSDVEREFKAGEKNGVVDRVKSCSEVEEDKNKQRERS